MQLKMFDEAEEHDPGGKIKTKLAAGIQGDAVFHGDYNRYRPQLRRWTGEFFPQRFVMFLGMNASTARADVNDPTITREWGFTTRLGYTGFMKFNVADFRATFPEDLNKTPFSIRSELNIPMIRNGARNAELIIICHGKLLKILKPLAEETIRMIVADGHKKKLRCFGRNADGSAKHPLYLKATTPIEEY